MDGDENAWAMEHSMAWSVDSIMTPHTWIRTIGFEGASLGQPADWWHAKWRVQEQCIVSMHEKTCLGTHWHEACSHRLKNVDRAKRTIRWENTNQRNNNQQGEHSIAVMETCMGPMQEYIHHSPAWMVPKKCLGGKWKTLVHPMQQVDWIALAASLAWHLNLCKNECNNAPLGKSNACNRVALELASNGAHQRHARSRNDTLMQCKAMATNNSRQLLKVIHCNCMGLSYRHSALLEAQCMDVPLTTCKARWLQSNHW